MLYYTILYSASLASPSLAFACPLLRPCSPLARPLARHSLAPSLALSPLARSPRRSPARRSLARSSPCWLASLALSLARGEGAPRVRGLGGRPAALDGCPVSKVQRRLGVSPVCLEVWEVNSALSYNVLSSTTTLDHPVVVVINCFA